MLVSEVTEYIADWDWEKNTSIGLKPEQITTGSRTRVYWKCHVCGGKWDTVMKERRGCPYCSGFKALPGFNDLATTHPEIAAQWSYEDNQGLTPKDVTVGSQKKVYWRCKKGHVWDALIRSRVKGQGCPYCGNRRVLTGYNDLATVDPKVAAEWVYELNGDLKPETVLAGTKTPAWWRCSKCGYEWRTSVAKRHRGNGCPDCAHYVVHQKVSDLETRFPQIAEEWDYEKNDKKPSEVAPYSDYRASWICPKGHTYKATVSDRVKGTNCPVCSRERRVSFPEKALYYYISREFDGVVDNFRASWLGLYELDIFIPDQKIGIEYDGAYGHSGKYGVERDQRKNKVCADHGVTLVRIREAKCPATESTSVDYIMKPDETLESAISAAIDILYRLMGSEGKKPKTTINIAEDSGAIYSLIDYSEKENSLLNKSPEIAKLWHPTKNGHLTPESVSWMSSKVVWWLGSCGHEWRSSVSNERRGGNCPYCIGKRVLIGFNDLATTSPELAAEWDREKNLPLTPEGITAGSGKKVWWKCSNGHSWSAVVSSRKQGRGCPICINRVAIPGVNDVSSKPELIIDWDIDRNTEDPSTVCIGTDREAWWKCHICGSRWKVAVADRNHGSGCPECARLKRMVSAAETKVKKSGSLMKRRPDLVEEWDWEKNKRFQPSDVTSGSEKQAWWICKKCGASWQASIASRNRKESDGCPECAQKSGAKKRYQKLLEEKGSLRETHPEIAAEWDYDKNGSLTPDQVVASSGLRAWWKCSNCGASWNSVIGERTRRKAGVYCRKCRRKVFEDNRKRERMEHL